MSASHSPRARDSASTPIMLDSSYSSSPSAPVRGGALVHEEEDTSSLLLSLIKDNNRLARGRGQAVVDVAVDDADVDDDARDKANPFVPHKVS